MRLLKELFCGWRGLLSLSASILSANLSGNSFAHALFYFSQKPGGISNDKKKWPHIPWRKSRRNCNIVAAVYAGCFPSNILNIAVLVPKAWIASLFSAFNNGSHAKLCRGIGFALLYYIICSPCTKSVAEFSLSPYAFATFHLQNNIYIQICPLHYYCLKRTPTWKLTGFLPANIEDSMHFREPPPNSYETADWRLRKKNKRQPIKNLPRLPGGEDLFFCGI